MPISFLINIYKNKITTGRLTLLSFKVIPSQETSLSHGLLRMFTRKFSRLFTSPLFREGCLMASSGQPIEAHSKLGSLLYIPNNMANKIVSILKPAVTLDEISHHPHGMNEMRANLKARGMTEVDLESLLDQWHRLESIRTDIEVLKSKMTHHKAGGGTSDEETSSLQALRELSKACSLLEETTIPAILNLPNRLHPRTIDADSDDRSTAVVGCSHPTVPLFGFEVADHVTLGQNTGTITFRPTVGPNAYYFKGSMAWLELATIDYFRRRFEEAGNFMHLSNPDFSKSIVVEGCGLDFTDRQETLHLELDDDANPFLYVDLHLTGSASTTAFCAFHAKTRVKESALPMRYFAAGRSYRPTGCRSDPHDSHRCGLFGVMQSSAMSFFLATGEETPADQSHDEMLVFLREAFDDLQLHFRVLTVPAAELLSSESLRSEIQMWSPAGQRYHTVASVSVCDDFISRRLLMTYAGPKTKLKKRSRSGKVHNHFLNVCHGTAVLVPPFLACIVENNQTKDGDFKIPGQLQTCIDRLKSVTYS